MTPVKILVVDDEAEIRRFLEAALTSHGYDVQCVENGKLALQIINSKIPDLIILDLGLPDTDGKAIISQVREWSQVPLIVLSARNHEHEKVEALDIGADDYLTKPFGTAELLARIKVVLRRRNSLVDIAPIFENAGLKIDLDKRRITLLDEEIALTPTEYKLLAALARNPGKVVTQNQLINEVWGKNTQGNSHYLRIYVQHLRQKLHDDPLKPIFILTEPGIGYRLIDKFTDH
jgi:two-component system KDP operon response regulator KdpE